MNELLAPALPWLPAALGPFLLLLAVPLLGTRGRVTIAMVLAGMAVASVVVAVMEGGEQRTLDVVNPFPRGADGELDRIVFETVTAPGYAWGLCAAAFLMLAMGAVFLRKNKGGKPGLVLPATLAGIWLLLLRLALEKCAAPDGLVWATGLGMALIPQGLMIGLAAGRRGAGFWKLLGALLLVGLLQRLAVSGASWVLTSQGWGTHLDMTPLKGFQSPFGKELTFETPMDAWFTGVLLAQTTGWVLGTVLLGLPLGTLGWFVSRKRKK